MANSLRAKLSKLRHDGHITDAEYQAFIKKLDGHDAEIRNKAILDFAERMCDRSCEESFRTVIHGVPYDILTQDAVADLAWEIEKELKGGAE